MVMAITISQTHGTEADVTKVKREPQTYVTVQKTGISAQQELTVPPGELPFGDRGHGLFHQQAWNTGDSVACGECNRGK